MIQGVLKVGLRPPLVLCEEALIQLTSTKTSVSIALLSPARINVLSQVNPVLRDKSLKSFSYDQPSFRMRGFKYAARRLARFHAQGILAFPAVI